MAGCYDIGFPGVCWLGTKGCDGCKDCVCHSCYSHTVEHCECEDD